MRKFSISLICLFGLFVSSSAQRSFTNEYALTHTHNYLGLSALEFVDPYLSLLQYSGVGIRVETNTQRYFNPTKRNTLSYGKASAATALALNPSASASVAYMTINGGWGVLYEHRDYTDFRLYGGGNIDFDFSYKMNSRNVNNPMSMEIATGLNAMLGGEYFIPTKRRVIKLKADLEFPVLGGMFAAPPGLTYYEMSLSGNIKQAMHFTHLGNNEAFKFQLALDVPFKKSTWSYGIRSQQMNYTLSNHRYYYKEFSFYIGIVYDYIRFSGRKNPNPRDFISPGEYFL